jgi:hypothetical protein
VSGEFSHREEYNVFTSSIRGAFAFCSLSQGVPTRMYLANTPGLFLNRSCVLAYTYLWFFRFLPLCFLGPLFRLRELSPSDCEGFIKVVRCTYMLSIMSCVIEGCTVMVLVSMSISFKWRFLCAADKLELCCDLDNVLRGMLLRHCSTLRVSSSQ